MKLHSKYSLLFSLLILPLLSQLSCDTMDPFDNLKPGRRDYTWTVDTLYLPFNPFTDITGTSPSDLWVCSPGDADKIFYHYDGNYWITDNVFRVFSPFTMESINTNNVFACGRQSKIWNFNGINWIELIKDTLYVSDDLFILEMQTLSESNIFLCGEVINQMGGYFGVIYKYDGYSLKKLDIHLFRTAFAGIRINGYNKIYLWGVTNEQFTESRYQFYELIGENLNEIYSGSQNTNAEYGSLLQLGQETYFIIGYDFFAYNGSNFQKLGRLTDNLKFRNLGIGRNKKDIFLFMTDGIMHYNGENSLYLYQTKDKSFVSKGILFDKEVFFLGRDTNGNNLIFHGKLNE